MKTVSKTLIGAAVVAMFSAAAITPAIVNAWGDSANGRPVYTLEEINEGKLGNKITFNSITNNEEFGDERNFVGALKTSEVKNDGNTWKADNITIEDGETYTIRLFVHNNSPLGEKAIAKDVKANFSLPTGAGKDLVVTGYITSSNATPNKVWDEVHFKSSDNFYLEYVEGSAIYLNHQRTQKFNLSNDIVVSKGATLGYNQMDGNIPGCYNYSGEVQIKVKAHKTVNNTIATVEKTVRMKGDKEWKEAVNAKIGDEVEYQIKFVNLMQDGVKDVMIRDILPTNVEYVKGSTVLYNSTNPNGLKIAEDTLTTTGINIGNYKTRGDAYVRFTVKVVDKTLACGDNQLVNWANATVNKSVAGKDDASVMVAKTCQKPDEPDEPEEPTETPEKLPDTGAGTVLVSAAGAGTLVTALGYYAASRKK